MKYYIGVDMGGTNTKIGIINQDGKIIVSQSIKTDSQKGYEKTIESISNEINHLLDVKEIDKKDILGMGVGVPGPVVSKSIVKFWANFPWPNDLNLVNEFNKYFNFDIFIDNDVNVITLGENWQGAAKGYENVIGVAIGTGIGGGLILNGKPVPGKNGAAGEIGHIKLHSSHARLCGCGQQGCFEAYASATGIIREALSRMMVSKNNALHNLYLVKGEIEAKDIFDCAKNGDEFSKDIVDFYLDQLALGLSTALNLIDPDIVVLGGGVSLAGDFVFEELKKRLKKYTLPTIIENLVLKKAELGNEAGIYGSAYLALVNTK